MTSLEHFVQVMTFVAIFCHSLSGRNSSHLEQAIGSEPYLCGGRVSFWDSGMVLSFSIGLLEENACRWWKPRQTGCGIVNLG